MPNRSFKIEPSRFLEVSNCDSLDSLFSNESIPLLEFTFFSIDTFNVGRYLMDKKQFQR